MNSPQAMPQPCKQGAWVSLLLMAPLLEPWRPQQHLKRLPPPAITLPVPRRSHHLLLPMVPTCPERCTDREAMSSRSSLRMVIPRPTSLPFPSAKNQTGQIEDRYGGGTV